MNFNKTLFALALGTVGVMGAMSATAATLTNGSTLSITGAATDANGNVTGALDSTSSWFGMDNNGDGKIAASEKTALFQGTSGIVIGAPQTSLGAIDAQWNFFSGPGYDYTPTHGITQTSATTLDMSGWTVNWNGGDINMGSGAWTPLNAAAAGMATSGYASGVGVLNWDGISGHSYTLDYTAIVPSGSFQNVHYALHLTGVANVAAVPEASTYGMMLAGLGLVGFAVRRRKTI